MERRTTMAGIATNTENRAQVPQRVGDNANCHIGECDSGNYLDDLPVVFDEEWVWEGPMKNRDKIVSDKVHETVH